jgi:tetratricopeptide (TPR) repeat protein
MKKKIFVGHITLVTSIMSLFLASCESIRYTSTQVQTLTPPARIVYLPSDTVNIAVATALHSDYLPDNEKSLDSFAMTGMAMAIKHSLEKSPKYSSYIFPVYTINAGETGLTEDNILDIKESSNANYLIVIEDFKCTFYRQRVRTAKDNCVRIITPHKLVVRIYEIDKFTIIDERTIFDTLTIQVDASPWETENEFMDRIPDDKASIMYIVRELAKSYAEEIIPFWKEETRFYYIDSRLAQAEYYIDDENWSKALDVWAKYVNDENRELAAIACFNMAVGCEMLGEYELALKWLENVKRKNPDYYWEEYKKLIERRIEEKVIIDKIMK